MFVTSGLTVFRSPSCKWGPCHIQRRQEFLTVTHHRSTSTGFAGPTSLQSEVWWGCCQILMLTLYAQRSKPIRTKQAASTESRRASAHYHDHSLPWAMTLLHHHSNHSTYGLSGVTTMADTTENGPCFMVCLLQFVEPREFPLPTLIT